MIYDQEYIERMEREHNRFVEELAAKNAENERSERGMAASIGALKELNSNLDIAYHAANKLALEKSVEVTSLRSRLDRAEELLKAVEKMLPYGVNGDAIRLYFKEGEVGT